MRAVIVIIRRVRGEKTLEMTLVQGDDVVEQIAPAAAHPAFRNSVLPGALDRGLHASDLLREGQRVLPGRIFGRDRRSGTGELIRKERLLLAAARSRRWWDGG